jgi:hypothetical protein
MQSLLEGWTEKSGYGIVDARTSEILLTENVCHTPRIILEQDGSST